MKASIVLADYSKASFFNDGSQLFIKPPSIEEPFQEYGVLQMKYQNRQFNANIFITGSIMKIIDEKAERYVQLENINFKKTLHPKTQQLGFRLSRNGQYVEFFGNIIEIWKQLKKYVIQTDFELKYKLGPKIGEGYSSSVHKAFKAISSQKFAVKIIEKHMVMRSSNYQKIYIINELAILRQVNHKNIIKLEETFEDEDNLYIVTELLEGGPLKNQIFKFRFSEQETIVLMQTLYKSLSYLHSLNIFHQDIRFDNILLRDSSDLTSACLINFGKAEVATQTSVSSQNLNISTFEKSSIVQYFKKKDIYALSIVILSIFTKKLYQESSLLDEIMMKNFQNMSDIEYMSLIPPLQDFFETLFTDKVNQLTDNLSCEEILKLEVFRLSFQRRTSKLLLGFPIGGNQEQRRSTRFAPRASQREQLQQIQQQTSVKKIVRLPTINDSYETKAYQNSSSYSPQSENFISMRFLNDLKDKQLFVRKSLLRQYMSPQA